MHITLRDITFRYDKDPVLSGIRSEVDRGDLVALVGPNGSGKSTLIKCINGILTVREGDVLIDGTSVRAIPAVERARKMAYVPQTEQKSVPVQVFDAVLLGRKPYIQWRPSRSDYQRTAEILKRLDLEDVAMREVHKLSGGQQQRVFIARALNQQPEILLLDEPTANLDLKYQMETLKLLRDLAGDGITVVIAMHDINMASLFANRVMMLKDGRIFASGGPEIVTVDHVQQLFGVKVRIVHENGTRFIVPDRF
ncbi:MAG: ABC transporter ATP-binding protein [Cyclonatronaceae bacterium]